MKAFILLCFLITPMAFAGNLAEIIYTKGNVEVFRNNYILKAQKGMGLLIDDVIVTKADSVAIISYLGNSKIKIDQSSSLLIEEMRDKEEIKEGGVALNLYLKVGSMLMKFVNPKHDKEIEVRTNQVALGVRGTEFFLGYEKDQKDVYMAVNEGVVDVLNYEENDRESVKAGLGMWIQKGSELTRPVRFDWAKKLNWNFKDKKGSHFLRKSLRKARRLEVRRKLKILFNRKRKEFKHKLKYKLRSRQIEKRKKIYAKRFSKKAKRKSFKKLENEKRKKFRKRLRRKLRKNVKRHRRRPRLPRKLPTPTTIKPPTETDSDSDPQR